MSVAIITRSDERNQQRDNTLREYGIDPSRATAHQKDMADCIAMETNRAYESARKGGH